MAAYHSHEPYFRVKSGSGFGVKAYQIGGTTVPISTYADKGKVGLNPWPVVLADDQGDGVALIYLDQSATIDVLGLDGASIEGYPAEWVKPAQQDDLEALDLRMDDAETDIALLQDAVAENTADIAALDLRMDAAENDIVLLSGRMSTAESNITSLDGRLDTAEGNITSLDGRLDTAESNITSLDVRLDTAEGDITALEGRMGTAESNITSLDGRLDAAESNITSLDGRLDTAEGDITALDGRLDTAESNITSLDGRLDAAESNITSLDGRLDAAESNITSLDGRLDTAEGDIDALDVRVTDAEGAIISMDGRIDALEGNATQSAAGKFYDPNTKFLQQWGIVTTAANGYATVTFPVAYAARPVVVVTSEWGENQTNASATGITTAGFTAGCRRTKDTGDPQSADVNWIAVGFAP